MRLRQRLMGAADAVKGLFGAKKNQDSAVEKLEALRVNLLASFAHRHLDNEIEEYGSRAQPWLRLALESFIKELQGLIIELPPAERLDAVMTIQYILSI